jgi:hypothetical protein
MSARDDWSTPEPPADGRPAQPPDDVDRLFARLEPASPPPDLVNHVLARTSGRERVRLGGWIVLAVSVGLLTALLAAVSGYLTGREFVQSGAYELLRLGLEDGELVTTAPGDYLLAVAEAVPWGGLVATIACVAVAYAVTRPLARVPGMSTARARERS